jgi:serine protease SohB
MDLLFDYALFLAKTMTLVAAVMVVVGVLASLGSRRERSSEHLRIRKLNERQTHFNQAITQAVSPQPRRRMLWQLLARKRSDRTEEPVSSKPATEQTATPKARAASQDQDGTPAPAASDRQRVFVLKFPGDLRASQVEMLREEISIILGIARPGVDEVVIRIESAGGMVHSYGLAAAQLTRLRDKDIRLTATVDKIAASGGYLMAAVADRIIAAPFAIVGSIGVVAQIPNFHRLLKKNDVDLELHTAGEHKRTLTMFGENTESGRSKFREELELTHRLFKQFVARYRPAMDMERVATGEHWYGEQAIGLGLVDRLQTSDDLLLGLCAEADVYEVSFSRREPISRRLTLAVGQALERLSNRW